MSLLEYNSSELHISIHNTNCSLKYIILNRNNHGSVVIGHLTRRKEKCKVISLALKKLGLKNPQIFDKCKFENG